MTTSRRLTSMSLNGFVVTKIHHDWDLRTVQWRIDVLREYVRNHKIKEDEAHIFINKNKNRSRWIVVWKETPFLIMAPAGHKLEHRSSMSIAVGFTTDSKIRADLLSEISRLV